MRLNVLIMASFVATATLAGCLTEEVGDDLAATGAAGSGEKPDPPTASFVIMDENGNQTQEENGTINIKAEANMTFDATSSSGSNVTFAWDMGDGTTFGEIPEDAEDPNATTTTPTNTTANTTSGNETLESILPYAPLGFQPNQTNTTSPTNETTQTTSDDNSVIVYAYMEAGNYTVTLYVTDDANQTSTSTAMLTVTPGGPPPGTFIRNERMTFSQSSTNVVSGCTAQTKDWMFVDVEAENGTLVEVKNVTIVLDGSGTGTLGSNRIYFIGPDGKEITSSTSGYNDKTLKAAGPFPAGKYQVKAEICAIVVSGAYTVNADAWYVAR